jgi:DNA-binding NarL/FixJ family response regulator
MEEMTRILIADDHQIFRDGLKLLLQAEAGLQVVGEAENGTEAVRLSLELLPDLVLMDLQMPELNGIEAVRQITLAAPQIKILMLTMFEDDASVFAAMRAGALGYVIKGMRRENMLRAVRAVAVGESIFSPGIAGRMMGFFSSMQAPASPSLFPQLSSRELEVLALLARDYKNIEIAEKLFISGKTVRNHVSAILSKLHAGSRQEAARQARDAGLG